MKKKYAKRISAMLLAALLVICGLAETGADSTAMAENTSGQENTNGQAVTLSNPARDGDKVTWDCVYFGSYPQIEVVSETDEETIKALEMDKEYYTIDYTKISEEKWTAIKNAEYDEKDDAVVDGVKYHRYVGEYENYKVKTEHPGDLRGHYCWMNNTEYRYYKYEPIKWRVLSVDGEDVLLLSDIGLDCIYYLEYDEKARPGWGESKVRSFLNGYDASANLDEEDYTSDNFIDKAFSELEKNCIKQTEVTYDTNPVFDRKAEGTATDLIYILSASEFANTSYGFNGTMDKAQQNSSLIDPAKALRSSTYAKARGAVSSSSYEEKSKYAFAGNCSWCTHTLGKWMGYPTIVIGFGNGRLWYEGSPVDSYYAMVPAMHIDMSKASSLITSKTTLTVEGCPVSTATPTPKPTPGGQTTPTPVPTATAIPGGQATPTATPTLTPTATPTQSPEITKTPTVTPEPTGKPTETPSSQSLKVGQSVKGSSTDVKLTVTKTGAKPEVCVKKTDSKKAKQVKIPETVKQNGVTYKVTSIAPGAFSGCSKLKKITIGKNITSIGKNAFKHCKALKSITVQGQSLKSIGKNAFKGTNKKLTVKVPKTKKKAYQKLFQGKGNTKLKVK